MPPEPASPSGWYAAFDALRQARPEAAVALAESFPLFRDEILGHRVFGSTTLACQQRHALSRAALEAVAGAVTQSLEEVLAVLRRRAQTLSRVRFGSGFVSILGSTGVLAALSANAIPTTEVAAAVAILASALNLYVTYVEDQSGGDGSSRGCARLSLSGPPARRSRTAGANCLLPD